MLCIEFQSLLQRIETIRIEMTMAYNQTVMKLTGLTENDLNQGILEVENNEPNIDSELQNFDKELMSMAEVFRIEGLVSDSIEVGPSAEQQKDSDSTKIGIVWQSAMECFTVKEGHEQQIMHEPEDEFSESRPLESDDIVDTSDQELSPEDTIEKFVSESNDGIVEDTGEDGTALYCIYDDVIETYSDSEEPSKVTVLNSGNANVVSDYEEVIIDSAPQSNNSDSKQTNETNDSFYQSKDNIDSTGPAPVSPTLTSEGTSLQPVSV
uniref:Uncharacterized protein n=1 Tax=Anopheles farauti TaxID=69004 RepID=A0A182Q0U0_9DIPT